MGQDAGDLVRCFVEEDAVGDGQREGDAGDLAAADEGDGERDRARVHFGLGNGEGGLHEEAAAEADQGAVAVDGARAGVHADEAKQSAAGDGEDSAEEVPGHVVSEFAHDGAVEDDAEDVQEHERKQSDGGSQRSVVVHKLEVKRDEVHGHVDGRHSGCNLREQDLHFPGSQQRDGDQAAFFRREDGEGLLKAEEDP